MPRGTPTNYTDANKQEFVELAQEIGIRGAMRELGYPGSYATAHRWAEERGTVIKTDNVMRQAAILNIMYQDRERLTVAQALYEAILERVQAGNLDAEELNKLANAAQRVVQTMQLIEGKATDRKEMFNRDGTDLELLDMLNEAKAQAHADMQESLHTDSR